MESAFRVLYLTCVFFKLDCSSTHAFRPSKQRESECIQVKGNFRLIILTIKSIEFFYIYV